MRQSYKKGTTWFTSKIYYSNPSLNTASYHLANFMPLSIIGQNVISTIFNVKYNVDEKIRIFCGTRIILFAYAHVDSTMPYCSPMYIM